MAVPNNKHCYTIQHDVIIAVGAYLVIKKRKQDRRERRGKVHHLQQKRKEQGAYHNLVRELGLDDTIHT